MFSLANSPIGRKLLLLSGVLLFALGTVGFSGYWHLLSVEQRNEQIFEQLVAQQTVAMTREILGRLRTTVLHALVVAETNDEASRKQVREDLGRFPNALQFPLDKLTALPFRAETKATVTAMSSDLEDYLTMARRLVDLAFSGRRANALLDLPRFQALSDKLRTGLDILSASIEREANDTRAMSRQIVAKNKQTAFWILLVAAVLALLLSWIISHTLILPLTTMATAATRIAQGDINQRVSHHSNDESGVLANAFRDLITYLRRAATVADGISKGDLTVHFPPRSEHDVLSRSFVRMIENLHTTASKLQQGTQVLTASIRQITTSTTQLGTSVNETATAVTQTATTVEEVKQAAQATGHRAQDIARMAEQSARASQAGSKAVEDAHVGMAHIREHMESIVQSVVEVDEQSQAISEIIATVTDLAEQAKILAINAAIEAVKAGEQGKGFTIVAQEIGNLATQSKHATTQVRTLLHDIQKAADKAVLVTEQGTKAVEVGEQQALAAGESIRTLGQDMREAAQAVMHIAATSQQQLAELEQAVATIGSIKQAAIQNVDCMKQIEQAVQNLQQVGQMLTEVVTQYKLTH